MELLIPGLILVALMVYASTKIKKNAAAAFERESIETQEFSIVKPAGFLHLLNNDSEYAFEAYSKEFGQDHAEHVRQATADVQILAGTGPDDLRNVISGEVATIISEKTYGDGIKTVEAEREENGIVVHSFYKTVHESEKVYRLRISVLPEYKDDYLARINEMLESFETR